MSSLVPERPTPPPLRSLALPMHGVPSKSTLPGIQTLYNDPSVRLLIFHPLTVLTKAITGPASLAAQPAGIRVLSYVFARAVSLASSIHRRPPSIHVIPCRPLPAPSTSDDESCGTTRSPCPDRFSRKRRRRSRFIHDRRIERVRSSQDNFVPRCLG